MRQVAGMTEQRVTVLPPTFLFLWPAPCSYSLGFVLHHAWRTCLTPSPCVQVCSAGSRGCTCRGRRVGRSAGGLCPGPPCYQRGDQAAVPGPAGAGAWRVQGTAQVVSTETQEEGSLGLKSLRLYGLLGTCCTARHSTLHLCPGTCSLTAAISASAVISAARLNEKGLAIICV